MAPSLRVKLGMKSWGLWVIVAGFEIEENVTASGASKCRYAHLWWMLFSVLIVISCRHWKGKSAFSSSLRLIILVLWLVVWFFFFLKGEMSQLECALAWFAIEFIELPCMPKGLKVQPMSEHDVTIHNIKILVKRMPKNTIQNIVSSRNYFLIFMK